MKQIRLYDYQQDMLANIISVLTDGNLQVVRVGGRNVRQGRSVMVQMPTGTGKTYVIASVVKWFLDNYDEGEVWIVAHRRELVEQMQQTLGRFCLDYGEIQYIGTRFTPKELKEYAAKIPNINLTDEQVKNIIQYFAPTEEEFNKSLRTPEQIEVLKKQDEFVKSQQYDHIVRPKY